MRERALMPRADRTGSIKRFTPRFWDTNMDLSTSRPASASRRANGRPLLTATFYDPARGTSWPVVFGDAPVTLEGVTYRPIAEVAPAGFTYSWNDADA